MQFIYCLGVNNRRVYSAAASPDSWESGSVEDEPRCRLLTRQNITDSVSRQQLRRFLVVSLSPDCLTQRAAKYRILS